MFKSKLFIISVVLATVLAACAGGGAQNPTATSPAATEAPTAMTTEAPTAMATEAPTAAATGGKIALLLPETKTTRYETADRPDFEAKMKELCPDCEIIYSNANQDASQQLSQAQAALANGAQVLVLDPVDSDAAGAIADQAKAQGVPVIAYDRLIKTRTG